MKKIAILLAVVLVVAMWPVAAFAADPGKPDEIEVLLSGHTVTITGTDAYATAAIGNAAVLSVTRKSTTGADEPEDVDLYRVTNPVTSEGEYQFDLQYAGTDPSYSLRTYSVDISFYYDKGDGPQLGSAPLTLTEGADTNEAAVKSLKSGAPLASTIANTGPGDYAEVNGTTVTTKTDGSFTLDLNILNDDLDDLFEFVGDSGSASLAMLKECSFTASTTTEGYTARAYLDPPVPNVGGDGGSADPEAGTVRITSPASFTADTADTDNDFTLTLTMRNYQYDEITVDYSFAVNVSEHDDITEASLDADAAFAFVTDLDEVTGHDAARHSAGTAIEASVPVSAFDFDGTAQTPEALVAYLNGNCTDWLVNGDVFDGGGNVVSGVITSVSYGLDAAKDNVIVSFKLKSGIYNDLTVSLKDGDGNQSKALTFPAYSFIYSATSTSAYVNLLKEKTLTTPSTAGIVNPDATLLYEIKASDIEWTHGDGGNADLYQVLTDNVTVQGLDSITSGGSPLFEASFDVIGNKTYLVLTAIRTGVVPEDASVTLVDKNGGKYSPEDPSAHKLIANVPTLTIANVGLKTSQVTAQSSPSIINIGDILKFEITSANFNWSEAGSYTQMLYILRNYVSINNLDTSLFTPTFGNEGTRIFLYLKAVGEGGVTAANAKFTLTDKTPAPVPQTVTITIPKLNITKVGLNTSTINPETTPTAIYPGDSFRYEIKTDNINTAGYGSTIDIITMLKNDTVIKGLNETLLTPEYITENGKTYLRLTAKSTGTIPAGSFTIEEKVPAYIPNVLTMVMPAIEITRVPVSITGNKIDGIDSSVTLGDQVTINDEFVSDVEDITIYPGESIYLHFDSDFFTWTNGKPAPVAAVTSAMLKTAKITVGSNATSTTSPVESVNLVTKSGSSMIEVKIKNDIKSTKDKKFSVTVYFNENGRRNSASQVKLSGVITQNEYEIYDDNEDVDMTIYPVVKAMAAIKDAELYAGEGITIIANLSRNRSYYASVNTDLTERDEAVMNRYPTVEEVYHLETSGFTSGKVTIDSSERMYVYDRDGQYLGTTDNKLALSDVYYLSTRRITMNIAPVTVDEDDGLPAPSDTGTGSSSASVTDATRPFVATFAGNLADLRSVQLAVAGGTFIDITDRVEKTAGSVIITIPQSYLSTLADGTYTLRANFAEGYRDVQFTVMKNMGTGTGTYNPSTGVA